MRATQNAFAMRIIVLLALVASSEAARLSSRKNGTIIKSGSTIVAPGSGSDTGSGSDSDSDWDYPLKDKLQYSELGSTEHHPDVDFLNLLREYVHDYRTAGSETQRSEFDRLWGVDHFWTSAHPNGGSALLAVAELLINSIEAFNQGGTRAQFAVPKVDGQTSEMTHGSRLKLSCVDENGSCGLSYKNDLSRRKAGEFDDRYIKLHGYLDTHPGVDGYDYRTDMFELKINKPWNEYDLKKILPKWAWEAFLELWRRHRIVDHPYLAA